MKLRAIILAATAAAAVSGPSFANADLARNKNCMTCHAVDKKLVGPGFKDVAVKYEKDKDAVAKLAEKIQKGGAGVWGPVPMPANPGVSAEEARALATWVMSIK